MVSQCNMYTWMKACFTEFTTFISLCNRTTAVKHCQKMAVLHLRTSSELSKAFLTKKSKSGIPTWEYLFDNGPSFVRPVKLFFYYTSAFHLSLSRVYTMLDISYLWELTCQQKSPWHIMFRSQICTKTTR